MVRLVPLLPPEGANEAEDEEVKKEVMEHCARREVGAVAPEAAAAAAERGGGRDLEERLLLLFEWMVGTAASLL